MDDLKDRKTKLEITIKQQENRSNVPKIKEEHVKDLFLMFRGFVKERNMLECKKFIYYSVEKVIVYKDHVEVIFDVAFTILMDYEA